MFFINPFVVYAIVWLGALGLYQLHYSNVLAPLAPATVNYILFSVLVVFFSWLSFLIFFCKGRFPKKHFYKRLINLNSIYRIRGLALIWSIGTLITFIYFHDLPIFAVFGWGHMTYADYGISSLQGFLNAIFQSISIYMLYKYIVNNHRKYLLLFLVTFVFPLLTVNRGMFTTMLLESLFTILVFRPVHLKSIGKYLLFGILFLYFFGWLGEVRAVGVSIERLYSSLQISEYYPSWLPKSFTWVYIYVTSPLVNINTMIDTYPNFSFEPYAMFFHLIPTVIRDTLEYPVQVNLINATFNVSSYMPNYLMAYGYIGSLIFYYFAALVPIYFYYKFLLTGELRYGFTLVIFLQSITLSIFSDFFFSAVYVFQIILQYYVFRVYPSKIFLKRGFAMFKTAPDYKINSCTHTT